MLGDGQLLCVRKRDDSGDICSFPGGGQEPGETLVEAVRREVREEVGREVEVGELLFVREYIGRNHEFAATDAGVHVVDHVFRCTLLPERSPNRAGAKVEEPPAVFRPVDADPDQVGGGVASGGGARRVPVPPQGASGAPAGPRPRRCPAHTALRR